MPETVVHIFEPTARSVFGHHFGYCERAAEFLTERGYDAIGYYAWQGTEDRDLVRRAVRSRFPFTFRFGRAFERSYGAEISDSDPLERRGLRQAKQTVGALTGDDSIEAENLLWRLRYDLDTVASGYALSEAETQVMAEAEADIGAFADMLAVNHARDTNVLFLPTGEYFLLRALTSRLPALVGALSQIHVRLWNFLSLEKNGADLVALALDLQRAAAGHGIPVHLYAEAPWACDHLARLSGTPAGYLDINSFSDIAVASAVRAAQARAEAAPSGRRRVFFPGAYRRFPDKGLSFLRSLLLLDPFPEWLELVIQQPDVSALRLTEAQLHANPNVTVLPRLLQDGEYHRQFRLADLICVPYDDVTWPDQFRGSGVIFEAFLAARPVAVTAKTPLARYGTSFVVNVIRGVPDFLDLLAGFDVARQERDAAENCRRYAHLLADNDLLRRLPPPGRRPLFRLRDQGQPASRPTVTLRASHEEARPPATGRNADEDPKPELQEQPASRGRDLQASVPVQKAAQAARGGRTPVASTARARKSR